MPEAAVHLLGPPLAAARREPAPRDWVQILVTRTPLEASRALLSRLACLRSLAGRLPGYLAHSLDGQIGGRVHRDLLATGFSQHHLSRALLEALRAEGFDGPACIVVGEPTPEALALLRPFVDALRLARQAHSPGDETSRGRASGKQDCADRSCPSCDERQVCDWVRAALAAESRNTPAAPKVIP